MTQNGLSRLSATLEDVLRRQEQPLGLAELAARVSATLGGAAVPAQVIGFVLQQSPDRYIEVGDGCWALRDGAAAPDGDQEQRTPPQPFTPNQAFEHVTESVVSY